MCFKIKYMNYNNHVLTGYSNSHITVQYADILDHEMVSTNTMC